MNRAVKYVYLLITLTMFLIFFQSNPINRVKVRLNPIQIYLNVVKSVGGEIQHNFQKNESKVVLMQYCNK